jgi:Flp pilus assembly protein TadG
MKRFSLRRFVRQTKGGAIVEFALVVPILFMMVWGIISFTRAYQRMNALTAALREGARAASTMDSVRTVPNRTTLVKNIITNFSSAFGYTVDVTQVNVAIVADSSVSVSVTNYPIFTGINFIGNLSGITITRQATFRCERNCND